MTPNARLSIATLFVIVFVAGTSVGASAAPADSDADGIPDVAEALLGTDPLVADTDGDGLNDKADPKPLEMADPIAQVGKPSGLAIASAIVENNEDPVTHKGVSDHLEMIIENKSGADIKGIEVFVTLKDVATGATENTYRRLSGVSIAKGGAATLHFELTGSVDFAAATDRFRSNPNSALYKTPNEKTVDIEIAAAGYAPARIAIKKDKGGAETAD